VVPLAHGSRRARKDAPAVTRSFQPRVVKTTSAADQIAQQLRDAMVSGQLQAGTRLSTEPAMAVAFGVSRATVREAIKILRAQGMLETVRGAQGGHRVATPHAAAVAIAMGETWRLWFEAGNLSQSEVDEARSIIESSCARLAAERRSDGDLDALRAAIRAAARPGLTPQRFFDLNVQFHHLIAAAAGNRLLQLSVVAVHEVGTKTISLLRLEQRAQMIDQHRRLLDAIEAQDPDAAERIFREHLRFIVAQRAIPRDPDVRTAPETIAGNGAGGAILEATGRAERDPLWPRRRPDPAAR
jgi:GntR family transcriptional repressor for pyruvate dehydrogenase complex